MTQSLDQEIAFYREHREQWIREGRKGEWCLIVGRKLVGFYPSFNDALQVSLAEYPGAQCLIREIEPTDRVESIQHVFLS